MIEFTAKIKKFGKKGEKTGWTYVEVNDEQAQQLNGVARNSFRVKGFLDNYPIKQVALLPMGDGSFILPLNADLRKYLPKGVGEILKLRLEPDDSPLPVSAELLDCLAEVPEALARFEQLPPGHRNYYYKWVESAKTMPTKAKRIAMTVRGMAMNMDYGQMIRYFREHPFE